MKRWRGVLSALVTIIVAIVAMSTGLASANPGENYVITGDSMSSGEAAPIIKAGIVNGRLVGHPFAEAADYLPGTFDQCDQAKAAWPLVLAANKGFTVQANVPCAGSTIDDFLHGNKKWGLPPQINAVRRNTTLVTTQLGGNDIGFPDIVACTTDLEKECLDNDQNTVITGARQKLGTLRVELKVVIREIHKRAPRAHIVLAGYFEEFAAPGPLGIECLGMITPGERAIGDEFQHGLNDQMEGAVMDARAEGINATYVAPPNPTDPIEPIPGFEGIVPVSDACLLAPESMMTGIHIERPGLSFHMDWLANQVMAARVGQLTN